MDVAIERLSDVASGDVAGLLSDSERLESRIVRRLVDEWTDGTNRFDRPGEALFGGVRHLYVLTASRRLGVGRQLMIRVIERAGDRFDSLRLRTHNEHAARLYLGMGFRTYSGMGEFTHVLQLARSSP